MKKMTKHSIWAVDAIYPSSVWDRQYILKYEGRKINSYIQSPKFKNWSKSYDFWKGCLCCIDEGEQCKNCPWFAKQCEVFEEIEVFIEEDEL